MIVLLWILSLLLALMFLMAGGMKLIKSKEALAQKMAWVTPIPGGIIKLIGLLEIIGVIGVVLPLFTSLSPGYSILGAGLLSFTMLGAIGTHIKRKEFKLLQMPIMFLIISLLVIYLNIPR